MSLFGTTTTIRSATVSVDPGVTFMRDGRRLYPSVWRDGIGLQPPAKRLDGQRSLADVEYEEILRATGGDLMKGRQSTANIYPYGEKGHPLWPTISDIFIFSSMYNFAASNAGSQGGAVAPPPGSTADIAFRSKVRQYLWHVQNWVTQWKKSPRYFFIFVHNQENARQAKAADDIYMRTVGLVGVATVIAGGVVAGALGAAGAAGAAGETGAAGAAGVAGAAGETAFAGATATATVAAPSAVAALPTAAIGLTEVAEGALAAGAGGLSIYQGIRTEDPDKIFSGAKTVASIDPSGLDLSGFLDGSSTTEGGRRLVSSLFGQIFPDSTPTPTPAPAVPSAPAPSPWKWLAIGGGVIVAVVGIVLLAKNA